MPKYVAFLRGVSPLNAKMPALKRCFEDAGFTNVKTLLSSGNVVFESKSRSLSLLAKKIEAAMLLDLARTFETQVWAIDDLRALMESDPVAKFRLKPNAKRVVTFLRKPSSPQIKLPIKMDGAAMLMVKDRIVFSVYEPGPKGPVFMVLIEKTFGKEVTTRTWETVRKVVNAYVLK